VIFIDLISTGLRDSVTYVQHVRATRPPVVFVIYCLSKELEAAQAEVYAGWGSRLRHYFLFPKETLEQDFDEVLQFNLARVQLDFYASGAQGSLSWAETQDSRSALSSEQLSKLGAQLTQLTRDLATLTQIRAPGRRKSEHRRAFVIMSFDAGLRDVYELGIKECLHNQFAVEAFRADEHYGNGLVIQQIYQDIHQSELVIAELTDPRPNCYYELGFADALGKTVIRLARKGTALPFDVNQHSFIFYSSLVELRERLASAVTHLGITT
jgi:hypothetical protein